MEKDLLYKTTLLQSLARLCPQFAAIASRHSVAIECKCVDEAISLAAGCDGYVPAPIGSRPMIPIFTIVGKGTDSGWTLPAGELTLSKEYFAKRDLPNPDYTQQLNDLERTIDKLGEMSPKAFAETLLTLLYKYASQIPAGIQGLDDVSLYDYIKTVAALSVAMSGGEQEPLNEKPFLLLGADFSGIQQYIYTIIPKRAAKSLKGRSFYLRLLSDTIVRYLLKELGLYNANVIYNSGGSFYILAPNSQDIREKIAAATKQIEDSLFKELGTQLFVAIDYVEMSRKALIGDGESLPVVWRELFFKRDRKKNHKFSSILNDKYDSFFGNENCRTEIKKDSITGEEFLPGEKAVIVKGDNNSLLSLRPSSALQIKIGEMLRSTDILVVLDNQTIESSTKCATPLGLGITYHFVNSREAGPSFWEQVAALGDKATIVTLNGRRNNCEVVPGTPNIYTLEFYGGNEMGRNVNTYEEMSESDGFTRMGVLRMDVDNLGTIFQSGIPAKKASLSRYASLSRSFDYFFSGYLNSICENYKPEQSQIIYSGGDDLFIVSRWDTAIGLAQRIRDDFKEYTCYNKSFSLSGGVAIVPPKFPIMAAAEESANEESRAKGHFCGSQAKNAISFMGTPLNWDKEFPVVKQLKDYIACMLSYHNLPSSFIQKVLQHLANAGIENHRIGNIKTYWMVAYDMKRMQSRVDSKVKDLINNFKNEVCDKQAGCLNGVPIESDYHPLELWALAARWAELEERTNNNNRYERF